MRLYPVLFPVLYYLGALIYGSDGYKMVVFVPNMANSQVQFCARVAETLANGGHDVTMLFLSHFSDFVTDVKIPKGVKVHVVEAFLEGYSKKIFEQEQAVMIYKDVGVFDRYNWHLMNRFMGLFHEGCRALIRNKEFTDWLANEKFDLAYGYIYSACPIGLIHQAKIPAWIWLNSGMLMDYVAQVVGVPIIPSYVPPMVMDSTDELTFIERLKSLVGHLLTSVLAKRLASSQETVIFREELNDPNFPDLLELGAKCPLIVVNSNELYDLPRPLLAKIVNIGGLGVGFETAKPLTGEFKKISEAGKGTIVFSFGSVAAAHEMPEHWKTALLEAFAEFPDYRFVMRYVENDLNDRLPKNVHLFKWLPQKDILLHNNTKAFITHGGYNSMQEAISAGVPMVTIALFGDQPKNSKIAKKHGFAVNLLKSTLSKETIVDGLEQILSDPSYSEKAKRLSGMVRKQPIKPAELLLKWSEFLAEFKTLENLEPAGQKLNIFQYLSLDVIAFILSIVLVVVSAVFIILRAIVIRHRERQFFTKTSILPQGIQNDGNAKVFADQLLPGERKLLFDALRRITADQYNDHKKVEIVTVELEDLKKVWYMNFVPMFVYGILDEAFLIIGGDTINHFFSLYNGMSMLASAAVANVMCNLILQLPVNRSAEVFGLKTPVLSADQMNTGEYKQVTIVARLIGLWLGLTLGMIPLFYIDGNLYDFRGENKDWLSTADKAWHREIKWDEYCDLKDKKDVSENEVYY